MSIQKEGRKHVFVRYYDYKNGRIEREIFEGDGEAFVKNIVWLNESYIEMNNEPASEFRLEMPGGIEDCGWYLEGYEIRKHKRGGVSATITAGNRSAGGRFDLDGFTYMLPCNEGENHLHGGPKGFDKQEWTITPLSEESLLMTRISPDGEEGYPGNLEISVLCTLTDKNELVLQYAAVTDAPTILNPTLHAWFNLHGSGEGLTSTHLLKINADYYTPVDAALIPTGEIAPVEGTPFDFRTAKPVTPEFDHNFVLRGASGEPAVALYEPSNGIMLKIYTDQPGLQLYTGRPDCGVVLETQHFPDSPHHADFPSTVLRPGEKYSQTAIYHFEIL